MNFDTIAILPMNKRKSLSTDFKPNKKVIKESKVIYCPRCGLIVSYHEVNESKNITCPKCYNVFIPLMTHTNKLIPYLQRDTISHWQDL